jgi:hypothetical protein
VFTLAPDASQFYYVFLRVRICTWLHEHPIRFLVNRERLWAGKIGADSKDVMLRVRKTHGALRPWQLRIEAEVDLSPEIRNEIATHDIRVPTIGFERLVVVPEHDVQTRLDVMCALYTS